MKKLISILFSFLLIFVLVGCGGSSSNMDIGDTESEETTEEKDDTQTLGEKMKDPEREAELNKQMNLTIGESGEVDGINITLDKVYLTEGDDYNFTELQPDHIFMVCQLTVINNSNEEFMPGTMQTELYADNTACETVVVNSSEEQYLVSSPSLAPGTNTTGVVAFDVPQSASNFKFTVTPSFTTTSEKKDIIYNFDTSQVS